MVDNRATPSIFLIILLFCCFTHNTNIPPFFATSSTPRVLFLPPFYNKYNPPLSSHQGSDDHCESKKNGKSFQRISTNNFGAMMMAATLSCKCGQVTVQFPNPVPRFSCECCCDDCHGRLSFYADAGGFALPREIAEKESAVPCAYMDNDMIVERGRDKIAFAKMQKDSRVTGMISLCCRSFLVAQHPRYEGNVVGVYTCFSNLVGGDIDPPIIRWFVRDWEDDRMEKLDPSVPGIWKDSEGNIMGIGSGWEKALERAQAAFQETKERGDGESFLDLMESCGKDVIIENN